MTSLVAIAGIPLGANQLPYEIPLHPNLVHFTLGLFIIGVFFDIAGTLFPMERPILKFLAIPALRQSFFDVGWYNLLATAIITVFTVAAGFFELMLAQPVPEGTSEWGLDGQTLLLLHGLGGISLLGIIMAMTVWRGFQRYRWRSNKVRQVQWSYLAVCVVMLGLLFVHGTLGAQLGDQLGVHNTAANLLRQGRDVNEALK